MKTSTFIALVTVSSIGGALYFGHLALAAFAPVGAFMIWQLHVLELKINRLLDVHGIRVSLNEMLR